ncbi:MAG TPA: magnesium/cobalt transporter CorA [bacterium]|nr:magnesium/cobalt transporter CorA [bacterium]
MPKSMKRRSKKRGLPPGTLVHIGDKRTEKVKITVMDYDENRFEEKVAAAVEDCQVYKDRKSTTWINIDGIHQVEVMEKLGKVFGLHPLVMEDIVNTDQRPKAEDYGDYLYIVARELSYNDQTGEIGNEQMSLILGRNFVLSFQETEGDMFDPIRDRIRNNKGKVRKSGADYLAYTLMDAIVDSYFSILEKLGERIESLEDQLVTEPTPATLRAIHNMKRDNIGLRRSVWPLREVITSLYRDESELINDTTRLFLRDVYDHTIQVIDTIETYRDLLAGMLDIYLSSQSNRMNEVMKLLTIIATIFIPLTFIAGVYGMNFKNMPEIESWNYGYAFTWAIMIAAAISMLIYFRRKKWL